MIGSSTRILPRSPSGRFPSWQDLRTARRPVRARPSVPGNSRYQRAEPQVLAPARPTAGTPERRNRDQAATTHPQPSRDGDLDHVGVLKSLGRYSQQTVWATCHCGWAGPRHPHDRHSRQQALAELETHQHTIPARLDHDSAHWRCGWRHDQDDDCPVPPDSPTGQLARITVATLGHPENTLDALAAITAIPAWLDDQEAQTLIAAALNHLTWTQLADAAGISIDEARQRWEEQNARNQNAGLLPAITDHP